MAKKRAKKSATPSAPPRDSIPGLAGAIGMDIPEVPEAIAPAGMGKDVPPRIKDGSPNPDHWRYRQSLLSNFDLLVMMGSVDAPKGWDLKKSSDMLSAEAKSYGIDPKHLADVRSEGEKHLDAAADICTNLDRIFEWADDTLKAVEAGMDFCETIGAEKFEERLAARAAESGVAPPDDPVGKIRSILRRVRTLRDRARNPIPKVSVFEGDKQLAPPKYRDHIVESVHLGRYMLYVGRSTIAGKRGGDAVLRLGQHHIEMLIDIWEAEKGAMFWPASTGSWDGRVDIDKDKYPYTGVIEVAPPGHGKTTICTGWCQLHISRCPDAQGTWLHDKEDQAQANVEMVKHAFKRDTEYGRRNLSLFPGLRLADKGNTTGKLTLHLDRPVKAPTLVGKSVWSSDLGTDNSFQVIDDVVPQKDIHEHARRERRVDMIATTWASRLRENGFRFIIGTLWHHEDVLAKMLQSTRRKSNPVWLRPRIQRCERKVLHGGKEKFIPLWPEMYPARKLGAVFHQMENKRLWYANYEGNPNPTESRIIQCLRYYDPELPDHRAFLKDATARGHISLDPAWTNREHSDKAGMVIGVVSKISGVMETEHGEVAATERQIRLTHAQAKQATAAGMNDNLEAMILLAESTGVDLDYIHIETNAAGSVIAETIENQFGVEVERHFSGKSKEIRLRRVMGMIDDSNKDRRACLLFPGKALRDESGELVLHNGVPVIEADPDWQWLYRQFLDFGFASDDHCLDATTQLANALSGEVDSGKGVVTKAIRANTELSQTQRAMRAILDRARGQKTKKSAETVFIESNWS